MKKLSCIIESIRSSFSVLTFEIDRVMVSADLDSRVWVLSLDGEVSCTVAYAFIRGLDVL